MSSFREAADDFLARKRIAVAGVSRRPDQAANFIFRKLQGAGYDVIPVNPHADRIEGSTCYKDLASIPGGVEGVIVATHPDAAAAVVRACAGLGIQRVWLHRSIGRGSVSDEAVRIAREHGLRLIPGGCPMMFLKSADFGHLCMRWILSVAGRLPREV